MIWRNRHEKKHAGVATRGATFNTIPSIHSFEVTFFDFIFDLGLGALELLDGMVVFTHLHQAFGIGSLDSNVLIYAILMFLG